MRLTAGQPVRPYVMHEVDIGNTLEIDITSLDFDNAKEAPSTLQYRIDNLTDVVVVRDWTTINTPAEVTTLTIPASLNVMYTTYRDTQLMQVTFKATYADGSQAQAVGVYQLNTIYQGLS